jgi:hypothetical protein
LQIGALSIANEVLQGAPNAARGDPSPIISGAAFPAPSALPPCGMARQDRRCADLKRPEPKSPFSAPGSPSTVVIWTTVIGARHDPVDAPNPRWPEGFERDGCVQGFAFPHDFAPPRRPAPDRRQRRFGCFAGPRERRLRSPQWPRQC